MLCRHVYLSMLCRHKTILCYADIQRQCVCMLILIVYVFLEALLGIHVDHIHACICMCVTSQVLESFMCAGDFSRPSWAYMYTASMPAYVVCEYHRSQKSCLCVCRIFFQAFLGRHVDHISKKKKIVNAGVRIFSYEELWNYV
jgi:hypothetical protein